MESKKWTLNSADWSKIFKGAAIAVVGALVPYLLQVVGNFDFGTYTPFVAAGSAIIANTILKFVQGA